jgi:predicted kinase
MRDGPVPTLVLFCGLPGSGKSTLARQLETQGRGIRLCTDDWQAALGVDLLDGDFHERLQRRLYRHALTLLAAGQDVILEDGLWFRSERDEKRADAARIGAATEMHHLAVPLDILRQRLAARSTGRIPGAVPIPDAELDRIWALFEPPDAAERLLYQRFTTHRAQPGSAGPAAAPDGRP